MTTFVINNQRLTPLPEASSALNLPSDSPTESIEQWLEENLEHLSVIDRYVNHILRLDNITPEIINNLYNKVAAKTFIVNSRLDLHTSFLGHPKAPAEVFLTALDIFELDMEAAFYIIREAPISRGFTLPEKVIQALAKLEMPHLLAATFVRLKNFDLENLKQVCENSTPNSITAKIQVIISALAAQPIEKLLLVDVTDYIVDTLFQFCGVTNDFTLGPYDREGKMFALLDSYVMRNAPDVLVDITPREMILAYAIQFWRDHHAQTSEK